MSQIETLAKPTLTALITDPSAHHTLDIDQSVSLALWATLKTIIVDHYAVINHGYKPFFTPQERRAFRDDWIPPRRTSAWIGRLTTTPTLDTGSALSTYTEFRGSKPLKHLCAYAFTFSAHELVIQTLSVRNVRRQPVGGLREIPESAFAIRPKRGSWSRYLIEILPDVGPSRWPPPLQLGNNGFKSLAYRVMGFP
jgi:hypothetical protein